MSPLLLHAITPSPGEGATEAPPELGLRGQQLREFRSRSGDLSGWATVWGTPDTQVGRADLFDHHRLVQEIWETCPCLPARFPTWVADGDALDALLEARRSEIYAALERVRDRAELAVTALWDTQSGGGAAAAAELKQSPGHAADRDVAAQLKSDTQTGRNLLAPLARPPNPGGAGRRYLEACSQAWKERDRRKEEARRFARALEEELAPWVVDSWYAFCPSDAIALSGALLVPSSRALELCDRAKEVGAAWPGLRTVVNGPWPPYTFSGLRGRELSLRGRY